jgi:putative thioredoxin
VDSDANPGLSQAFRVQSIPSVFALIAGQPVPMFQGALPEPQVRQVFEKLLEAAAQAGVTGTVDGAGAAAAPEEPAEDPRYVAVHEAIEAGQFDVAAQAAKALVDVRDPEGPALLAYAGVRKRMASTDEALARAAFAAAPTLVAALLGVSDFDFFAVGPKPVYDRLIDALRASAGDDRDVIKQRLLDYFAIDGATPDSIAARKAMTAALF